MRKLRPLSLHVAHDRHLINRKLMRYRDTLQDVSFRYVQGRL